MRLERKKKKYATHLAICKWIAQWHTEKKSQTERDRNRNRKKNRQKETGEAQKKSLKMNNQTKYAKDILEIGDMIIIDYEILSLSKLHITTERSICMYVCFGCYGFDMHHLGFDEIAIFTTFFIFE